MSTLSWPLLGHLTGGSSGGTHLNFRPADTSKTEDALRAAETACELAIQQIPREVEVSQELLRYSEGEEDAVPITERDMEELQPGKFLGNNIVDFYIRFLQSKLSPEHRKRFYFFNTFFYQKLSQSSAPTRIDPCKVEYEQLRRWTEKVNLFEKDYVFIPILESSHWSLVIICHLSSLTCAPDEMMRYPCLVHLDPIEGHHGSFEGLIRSYVLQAWMERFEPSIHKDQLLALYQMKYVQAKVPQQVNSYDCGLYVLNYIEVFLIKSTSLNFNFASIESSVHFTSAHFVVEVSSKRRHIQTLILELIQISQERTRKLITVKNLVGELLQASQNLRSFLYDKGHSQPCIQDVPLVGSSFSNSEDCGITHASKHEDSMDVQHHQSPMKSRENDEPLDGPQIGLGFVEYENGSESLSPQEQHVEIPKRINGECEIQTTGPSDFKGSILMAKHASTHEDSINVEHQQSSKIARLNYEQGDGLGLQSVKFQSFLDKCEEIPCMDLSDASKGKYKRAKNMTHEETSMLLSCKMEEGRFCKGSGGATHWNLISKEIEKKLGSQPSADQCRLRYDTLLKAYKAYKKHCNKTGKTFFTITKEERLDLKVATTLCQEWYTTIGEICDKAKSRKCTKTNHGFCDALHPLSSHDSLAPTPPQISNGRSFEDGVAMLDSVCGTSDVALGNFFPMGVLSSLNEGLQSTLLNLVQECLLMNKFSDRALGYHFELEGVCQRLAVLQDCESNEILNHFFNLWELNLVSVINMDLEEAKDIACIHLLRCKWWYLNPSMLKEILEEVLGKNPHLLTYYNFFPIEESSLQYVKVLSLYWCGELKYLDLKDFPNLQVLEISYCPQFKLITSWEVATSLKSICISWCDAYHDFSNLRYLFSLRELLIKGRGSRQLLQFSQCVKLQKLEIWNEESMSKIVDLTNLKDLKFLEHLALRECTFSNIQGLSGLQALKTLRVKFCNCLKMIPDLGCLKGLMELDMSFSGVEDVEGVGELHLLTLLDFCNCRSLERLPFLGHLTALVYLDLRGTGVKEIPGKENLIDLKIVHLE